MTRFGRTATATLLIGLFALCCACGSKPLASDSAPAPNVADADAAGDASALPDSGTSDDATTLCQVTQTDVTGITVTLSSKSCTFHVGEAGTFAYSVTVGADAASLVFAADRGSPGPDPTDGKLATLVDWRIEPVTASGSSYCADCDLGLGPMLPAQTVTLERGTFAGTMQWPGRVWGGPSDTGNPLGPAFAPASYRVVAVITGTSTTLAALPIQVIP
jgi:hypothetical protein